MSKIIILGGTFDPFHNGHLKIAKNTLTFLQGDEIWLLPAHISRWKTTKTSINQRLKMLELVCKNEKYFSICKYEIENKKPSLTYETMLGLTNDFPQHKFYFIIGTDQLLNLPIWYEIDKLSTLVQLVVYKRPGYNLDQKIIDNYHCITVEGEELPISSTNIREELTFSLIPFYLEEYLMKNLYYHKQKLKKILDKKRYLHSVSTMILAGKIAKKNHLDLNLAKLAGLLHDCGKNLNKEEEDKIMEEYFSDYLPCDNKIIHQFTGAYIAQKWFNVKDERVINAIKWHTSGRKKMDSLEKIIYISDKIEKTRGYDSTYMINACLKDYETGFRLVLKDKIKHLAKKGISIENKYTKECIKEYLTEE